MADEHLNNSPEIWKAIPGFEGYEVSDQGRVRSFWKLIHKKGQTGNTNVLTDNPQKILKNILHNHGYLMANLFKNKKSYRRFVHRLVLETFVGPCPSGMEACHGDGIFSNDSLENLRWDTRQSNINDRIKHGSHGIGIRNAMAKLNENQVKHIRYLYSNGYTIKSIGELFHVSHGCVSGIVYNVNWKHI